MRGRTLPIVLAVTALIIAVLGFTPALEAGELLRLPKKIVGQKQIKPNAVTGEKVKNGSLELVDLSKKARKEIKRQAGKNAPAGPPGLQGLQGPAGPQGPAGDPAFTSYQTVVGPTVVITPADIALAASAVCPVGTTVIGGGFFLVTGHGWVALNRAFGPSTWTAIAVNSASTDTELTAYAYCASGVTSVNPPLAPVPSSFALVPSPDLAELVAQIKEEAKGER